MSEDMKDLFGNVVNAVETEVKAVEAEAIKLYEEAVAEVEKAVTEVESLTKEGMAYVEGLFHKTEAGAINMNSTLAKAVDTELKSVVVEATGSANGTAK